MVYIERRRFLQATSALVGSLYFNPLFGADAGAPKFVDKPSFEPTALFLTWQRDPTTTMTIQWIGSEEEGANRPIWYAKKDGMLWQQAAATPRPFPTPKQKIFRTELTGLEPGGEYVFRVGLDSAERRFRTMPAKATDGFAFVSGGDSGAGQAAQHVNKIAGAQDPMFVLLGGDLAYENGIVAKAFLQFLQNYSSQVIDSQGRMIPLVACIGNHEVRGGFGKTREQAPFYYSVFDGLYPETGYATLDFGDYLSLVLLDSNHTTPIPGEQTSWLEKALQDRQDCPNVFVAYHVPSYPSFRPYDQDLEDRGTGAESRQHWVPLFERYNVDAVLEHHDHTYKRTHPLIGGHIDTNGIRYLGDGSWGKIRPPKTPEQRPYLAIAKETYHLSLHRLEGKQRFHVALSDTGKVVDVCTTQKRASA